MLKLIKLSLISLSIFLIYSSKDLLVSLFNFISDVITPLLIGFIIAYILYPILKKINFIPKLLGIFIIEITLVILIFLFGINIFSLSEQIIDLISSFNLFVYNLSLKYNFDITFINNIIDVLLDYLINTWLLNNPLHTIELLISFLGKAIIIIISSIYFLIDMDKIINFIEKNQLYKKINIEVRKYFNAFSLILLISFIEYGLLYFIIGHDNYFLLGFLASIGNFIPVFGSLIVHIVAYITVFQDTSIVPLLVVFLVTSILDNFIINPLIYSKTTKIHPLIIILAILLGNVLFGIIGFLIALPILIIGLTLYKNAQQNRIYCEKTENKLKKQQ